MMGSWRWTCEARIGDWGTCAAKKICTPGSQASCSMKCAVGSGRKTCQASGEGYDACACTTQAWCEKRTREGGSTQCIAHNGASCLKSCKIVSVVENTSQPEKSGLKHLPIDRMMPLKK